MVDVDGLLEFRQVFGRDDAPLHELRDDRADALMHDQLGGDQDRQRDEETDVRLDVVEERDPDRAARAHARERRQQQQRQPGDARDDQHPPAQQLQRVSGQVRAAEKLEQRTAEHQREVRLFLQDRGLGHPISSRVTRQTRRGAGRTKKRRGSQ